MKDSGFTLLELIISIALIGIIVLIITGAMRLGFRSIDSVERKIESLERIKSTINIIDSQIQSQSPITYDEEGVRKYYFRGESRFMQFSTNYSIWGGQKGYVIVRYNVETDSLGKQYLAASENIVGLENTRELKLSNAYDSIYFEYFYKDPTEEQGSWVEQLNEDAGIPEEVKVHFVEGMTDLAIPIQVRVNLPFSTGIAFPPPPEEEGGGPVIGEE
jgi:general secretion pathway protein J